MGPTWMYGFCIRCQQAPAPPGGTVTRGTSRRKPSQDCWMDPAPKSACSPCDSRASAIPEGHDGAGDRQSCRIRCLLVTISLFFVPALQIQWHVSKPYISRHPEFSAFPTCAPGLCNHPASSGALPGRGSVSFVSPKLLSPDLGQEGLRIPLLGNSPSRLKQLLLGQAITGRAGQKGSGRLHLPTCSSGCLPLSQQGSAWHLISIAV